jgi:hypothetical protein
MSCLAEEASSTPEIQITAATEDCGAAPQIHHASYIRRTMSLGSVDGECVGDFGPRTCLLPTIRGSHPDLNCIDPKTVIHFLK